LIPCWEYAGALSASVATAAIAQVFFIDVPPSVPGSRGGPTPDLQM
jgi:hypothetical protein